MPSSMSRCGSRRRAREEDETVRQYPIPATRKGDQRGWVDVPRQRDSNGLVARITRRWAQAGGGPPGKDFE